MIYINNHVVSNFSYIHLCGNEAIKLDMEKKILDNFIFLNFIPFHQNYSYNIYQMKMSVCVIRVFDNFCAHIAL